MKNGDEVIVRFEGGFEPDRGILMEHSDDWKNVTIKTEKGGEMNGMVEAITEASLFK